MKNIINLKNIVILGTLVFFSQSSALAQAAAEQKPEQKPEQKVEEKVEVKAEAKPESTVESTESYYSKVVEAGVIVSNGASASSRFFEYADPTTGVLLNADAQYYKDGYHADIKLHNIERKDLSYTIDGGKYDKYKYSLWYTNTYHRLGSNDLSFYSGIGTQNLTFSGISGSANTTTSFTLPAGLSSSANWNTFEYSTTKNQFGTKFEYQADSPLFGGFAVNRSVRKGLVPMSGVSGINLDYKPATAATGASSNNTEFPAAVNDQVNLNVEADVGYRSDKMYLSLNGESSTFTSPHFMTWRSPSAAYMEVTNYSTIAPDSNMTSLSAQGTIYKLPLASTLQLRANVEQSKSKFDLLTSMWSSSVGNNITPSYQFDALTVNTNTFNGDVTNTTVSAVWRGMVADVDFDLHYRNIVRVNNSDTVSFSSTGPATTNGKFAFNRSNIGIDLSKKIATYTRIKANYDNDYVSRTDRADGTATKDNKFKFAIKNTTYDLLNVNLVAEKLYRTSDFSNYDGTPKNDNRRYSDVTDKNSDSIKLEFTSYPKEHLDFNFGGKRTVSTYPATVLGLLNEVSWEAFLNVGYNIPEVVKMELFADAESYDRNGQHLRGTALGGPYNTSNYLWQDNWVDRNYWYGMNFIIPIIEDTLSTKITVAREESFGTVDFTFNGGPSPLPTNISNMGTFKKTTLTAKLDYNIKKNLRAAMAGIVESLDGDDLQVKGYVNAFTGPNKYMLFSGAGADNSYDKIYAVQATLAYDF